MKNKFKAEIDKQNFTFFEWTGMKSNPKLALEIGMALGYKLALNDVEKEVRGARDGGDQCALKK